MSMPNKIGREVAMTAIGAARGAGKGAVIGGALSIATGAAVIVSLPGTIPAVGGIMAIKAGTIGAWSIAGSIAGGITGAVIAYAKGRQGKKEMADFLAELNSLPATG